MENKIFIVIGVLVIIFVGIVVYLVSIDQKLRRIEKEISHNPNSESNTQ